MSQQAPAHLSVVVLKVAQLETLLQFGVMPHPELIESPFCLVQLRQQSERDGDGKRWRWIIKKWIKSGGGRNKKGRKCSSDADWCIWIFFLFVCVCARYIKLMLLTLESVPSVLLKIQSWLTSKHTALPTIIPTILMAELRQPWTNHLPTTNLLALIFATWIKKN